MIGDPLHRLSATYCGVFANQWWADLFLLERVLEEHAEFEGIVELGTGDGGLSLFLSHQAAARALTFDTFDVYRGYAVSKGLLPERFFHSVDVFRYPDEVGSLLDGRPVLLVCDDGDKRRELAVFAPLARRGSLLAVHDWGFEVGPDDLPTCLTPIHEDLCEESLYRLLEVR